MKVALVVGARPNLMKAAPLARELRARSGVRLFLIHTGQHYSSEMSGQFFAELDLPAPDVNLDVGSGPVSEQIGLTMVRLGPVLRAERPDVLVIVGDVNATAATALAAQEHRIPVAHVEAGLRSYDRTMPEEINRVVADALSDLLFTTAREAAANLQREGIAPQRIHFVGNIMIDTLVQHLDAARALDRARDLGLPDRRYTLLTLHRPSNVDTRPALQGLVDLIRWVQGELPLVFPVHPRTQARLAEFGLDGALARWPAVRVLPPLSYREFLSLEAGATLVMTDSGGVQEETTFLGVPCLTLRENTERPITVREGTNEVVGTNLDAIQKAVGTIMAGRWKRGRVPELWDGRTAGRIVDILLN